MNKIYKLVWNQVRGCYVVASEFAKSNSRTIGKAVLGAVVTVSLLAGANSVYASGSVADGSEGAIIKGYNVNASKYCSTAMGKSTTASGDCSIAMGVSTIASEYCSTAMGLGTKASGDCSTAMGRKTTASGKWSTAMGYNTVASGFGSIAMGVSTIASGVYSTAIGEYSVAGGKNSLAALGGITDGHAVGSMAVGVEAKTMQENTFAIGAGAEAQNSDTVAIGNNAKATLANSVALGAGSVTDRANSVAVGNRQITGVAAGDKDTDAVNLGQLKLKADKTYVDAELAKKADKSYVNDELNKKADKTYVDREIRYDDTKASLALGGTSVANASGSVAVGEGAQADTNAFRGLAIGKNAKVTMSDAIAVGSDSTASNHDAIALGTSAIAKGQYSVAIGTSALAVGNDSVALGSASRAYGNKNVAIGEGSVTTDNDYMVVSFGDADSSTYRRLINVADGEKDHDAVNNKQLKAETVRAITAEEANKKAIAELATGKLLGDVENFKLGDAFTGELVETKEGKKYFAMDINEYGNIRFADMGKENLNVVLSGNGFYAQDSDSTTMYETVLNERGLEISAGDSAVKISANGIDLGGSKLTNVAAGTADNDAVNKKQLDAEATRAQAAEKVNADAIVAEADRAKAAETKIDGRITKANSQIETNRSNIETLMNSKAFEGVKIKFDDTGVLKGEYDEATKTYTIKTKENIGDTLSFSDDVVGNNGVDIGTSGFSAHRVDSNEVGYLTKVDSDGVIIGKGERQVTINAEGMDLGGGTITGVSAVGSANIVGANVQKSSIAIGHGNEVYGLKSTAVGYGNVVNGNRSGAFGDPNNIDGAASYAVGNDNYIADGQHDVFVLGNKVTNTASNSVVLGTESEAKEANVVSVGAPGKERKIVNVADPENPTDAVNLRTLEAKLGNTEALDAISNRVNRLDSKINRTGAHAAALAALRPADFDGKLSVAAGLGNYHGSQAGAIGLFYKPTDRISFNLGGTMGGKENMANFGISFALDRVVPHGISSRGELNKKLQALSAENAEMKALVANQAAENAAMKAENAEMKADNAAMKAHISKQDAEIAELKEMMQQLLNK